VRKEVALKQRMKPTAVQRIALGPKTCEHVIKIPVFTRVSN